MKNKKQAATLLLTIMALLTLVAQSYALTVTFSGTPDPACSGDSIIPYGPADLLYESTSPITVNTQYQCLNFQTSNAGIIAVNGGLTPDGQPDTTGSNKLLTGNYYDQSTGTLSGPVPILITFAHPQGGQITFDIYADVGCDADTVFYTLKNEQGVTVRYSTITSFDIIQPAPLNSAIIAGRAQIDTRVPFSSLEIGPAQGGNCGATQGSVSIDNIKFIPYIITTTASQNGTVAPPQATLRTDFATTQLYTFTPDPGYMVGDLTIDGVSLGKDVTTYTFFGINSDHSINVTFSPQTYTITATAGTGGSISPSGTYTYNTSSSQVFNITADPGYTIADVTVDGTSVGTPSTYAFSGINSNHTINAIFTNTNTYTITATSGTNGTMAPTGTVNVPQGTNKSFTFTPSTGYRIGKVTVDGMPKPLSSSYTFTNVQQNHTIDVTFVIDAYTITAIASPPAAGSITPPGATTISAGSSITYNIQTNPAYRLINVSIDSSNNGPITSYTLTNINSNHTITAYYEQIKYDITATTGPNGTINPSGTLSYAMGTNPSFTISPNPGYHIANVTVDGAPQGPISAYTFQNITAAHTISATFDPNTSYTITASSDANGTITPSGTLQALGGTSQIFNWMPNQGYRIASVTIDGTARPLGSSYNFSNIAANHSISVTFTPDVYNITASLYPAGAGTISPAGVTTLNIGSSQSYTITTNQGYTLTNVMVDGVSQGPITSYSFNGITFNHTITAYYKRITYTITPTANTGGTINPSATLTYNYASTPSFTISPTLGYHLLDTLVDGTSVGPVTTYTFAPLTGNHTIAAVFEPNPSYTITATAGSNGTISPSGATQVLGGTRQTFVFTPDTGYRIGTLTVDGTQQNISSSYAFKNIAANHTIAVTFVPDVYNINASAYPSAGGTITPSGTTTVSKGGGQSYTITTNQGYILTSLDVNGISQGPITAYTFTNVTANKSIVARFTKITYSIAASAGPGGTITPSGNLTYAYASTPNFVITPIPGYHVDDVQIDGTSIGPTTLYTFAALTANHSIAVTFAINPTYTIIAAAGPNGTITPSGTIPVLGGTNQTFTFAPETGYRIASVTVDGMPKRITSSYAFSRVAADHTISVTFTPDVYTITASTSPTTGGTISPSGPTTLPAGSTQTYTIDTNTGYTLLNVTVDGISQGPITSYTFNSLNYNHTITAYYSQP